MVFQFQTCQLDQKDAFYSISPATKRSKKT